MKIKELKDKLGIGKKWNGTKRRNCYTFDYIGMSIGVREEGDKYKVSISARDGYISKNFRQLDKAEQFINNNVEV